MLQSKPSYLAPGLFCPRLQSWTLITDNLYRMHTMLANIKLHRNSTAQSLSLLLCQQGVKNRQEERLNPYSARVHRLPPLGQQFIHSAHQRSNEGCSSAILSVIRTQGSHCSTKIGAFLGDPRLEARRKEASGSC